MGYHLTLGDTWLQVRLGRDMVEVRGQPNYATQWRSEDPLHSFLDRLDPATVSTLFGNGEAHLNPRNARSAPSLGACAALLAGGN